MIKRNRRVCPVEVAGHLDNIFRKWVHNPKTILREHIKEGMVVLDVGCGPGLFSVEIAKIVGKSGKVIAVDLQEGMLKKLRDKIQGNEIEKWIKLHKCTENKIAVSEKVDFVLAFYMVHEVPDQKRFLTEIRSILKKDSSLFIIEPSFHLSKHEFEECIKTAVALGFKQIKRPRVFLSRAVVLKNIF